MPGKVMLLMFVALFAAAPAQARKKPADLFYFAHGLDEQAYVQLDSHGGGVDVRSLAEQAQETRRAGWAHDGYAIFAALPVEAAGKLKKRYASVAEWKVMEGAREACSGKLGRPSLVGFVIPHFGEVQQFEELKVDINDGAAAKYRKGLLSQARLFLVAPVTGCKVDRKSGFLWAAPKGVQVAGAFFTAPPAQREKHFFDLALSLPAFKKSRVRVDKAYAEEGADRGKPREQREVSCSYYWKGIVTREDRPERSFCHASVKYGSTFCGEGPDEAMVSALFEVGKEKRGPLVSVGSPDSEYWPFEPVMLVDLFGDGSFFVVAKTDELSQEFGLFRIKEGRLERIKATGVAFNDCPC